MKIGLKLAETGYCFGNEERARIYLTNALEPWAKQLPLIGFDALAHEAAAVNEIKRNKRFTVVIGNPPYSNFGKLNKNSFILDLLSEYKQGLGEKKLNLDDDYIKFFRLGQKMLSFAPQAVLGYVTNSSFLDGATHRAMRKSLTRTFANIKIVNLHGNIRRKEKCPDGSEDQPVFSIQQGVSLFFGTRCSTRAVPTLVYADLWGTAETKLDRLAKNQIEYKLHEPALADSELHLFIPTENAARPEYDYFIPVPKLFSAQGQAIQTKRDSFALQFDKNSIVNVVKSLKNQTVESVASTYSIPEVSPSYSLHSAKQDVLKNVGRYIPILIRPFDVRWTYFTGTVNGFHARPRKSTTEQMLRSNMALIVKRQTKENQFSSVWATKLPVNEGCFSIDPRGRESLFCIYDATSSTEDSLFEFLKSNIIAEYLGDATKAASSEQVFAYIYAILHSSEYRSRYIDQLKREFPRIPPISNLNLFSALVKHGSELVKIHTTFPEQLPSCDSFSVPRWESHGRYDFEVKNRFPIFDNLRLYINESTHITPVAEQDWDFQAGGYQICHKWLKDRRCIVLTDDLRKQYITLLTSVSATRRLIISIDGEIKLAGGWCAQFV